jgi:DNA segregation ATPase FtsK/SpoIIIE-like protein
MKTIKIISLFFVLFIGICISPQKAASQDVSVNFQVFYDELSPYGTWVINPDYGYVWIPSVDPGFTPYATNGYWVFTDEGWTWVSNYSWGWAPFHYGRWYTDPYYGPMWVPDNEWGPGWVTWRRSANYYGWAPIGPGVSISVAYGNNYYVPYNQYTFVSGGHMGRTNINNYYINNSNNVTIINNSTVINNIRVDKKRNVKYNPGPDRNEVEKRVGRVITPVAIRESSKPGEKLSNNQLQIYRPQVQKTVSNGPKPAPSRVESLKNVKPAAQRTTETPAQNSNQPNKQQAQPQKKEQQSQPRQQQQSQPQKKEQQSQPKQQQQAQPQKKEQQSQPKQQQQAQPQKKEQPSQQQHQATPARQQQQAQPQKKEQQSQPPKQQQQAQPQKQQQHQAQPPKQKQQEPKQTDPPKKGEKEKQSDQ